MAMRDPAEAARERLAANRQQALEKAELRKKEVYDRQPQFYQLDQEIARLAMEIPAAALGDDADEELTRLQRQMGVLQEKKAELLSGMGFPSNYLTPPFSCSLCQDTGFSKGKRCRCYHQLYQQEAAKNLPTGGGQFTFEQFSLKYYPMEDDRGGSPRRTMERILAQCMEYAEEVGRGAGSLLFCGKTGLGKTHLALAIAGRTAQRGLLSLYSSTQGAVDHYERIRFNRSPTQEDWDFISAVSKADLVVLDDLGSEFVTAFSQSVLYNMINDRMMNGGATIITTNLEPAKLAAQYEQRIASRILCGYTSLIFTGKDIRMVKRMENTSKG